MTAGSDFADRVAVVTGGSQGIGQAIAEKLAAHGARVVLAARRLEPARAVAAAIRQQGGAAEAIACDVTDEESVQALVEGAVRWAGQIDILVNSAGIVNIRPHEEITMEQWRESFDTNLTGPWLCSKHASPWLRRSAGGRILNISSTVGQVCLSGRAMYGTSKAALNYLTRVLALEYAADRVTVNAIAPGTLDTNMTRELFAQNPGLKETVLGYVPMGQQGRPEDVAAAALFLASPAAWYITGQTLHVDGGWTAGQPSPRAMGGTT